MRNRQAGHWARLGSGVAGIALLLGATCASAAASEESLLLRDSFPLGAGGSKALCQVQSRTVDPANSNPMDRTWAIVCRDSALPVGYVFALRHGHDDELARLAQRRGDKVNCAARTAASVGGRMRQECRWKDPDLAYEVVSVARGNTTFVVEGFSAYHGALDLALRSIYADRLLDEPIEVATTSVNDTEAYARIQALTLDPATALAEGYRRNNSGDYAEAAAYFETLDQRQASSGDVPIDRVEFLVNAGLQRSNLGQFSEADRLFSEADAMPAGSGVVERLRRNYEAIHLLNQEFYAKALDRLGAPLRQTSAMGADSLRATMELTPSVARRINASDLTANAMGLVDDLRLTDDERATILDAQSLQLRGTALRLLGQRGEARSALEQAQARALAVRNGRVVSIVRMRAQLLTELATLAEEEGRLPDAEALLRSAVDIVGVQYPETRSMAAAQARLAAYLVRQGRPAEAEPLYREVVARSVERENGLSGLSRQMAPYFDLLAARMGADTATSDAFFQASQVLVRPGVAETQAVLSRELSGGSDEAARLFRQSSSLTRAVERARMTYAALQRLDDAAARTDEIAEAAKRVADLEAQEQATVIDLANYARYRVVTQRVIGQKELQEGLGAGEVYAKMAVLGPDVFVFFAGKDKAVGYRAPITSGELEKSVQAVRDSISRFDGKQHVTGTFAANEAAGIFKALFGPVATELGAAHHLIFEPDGAMLKLPVNVLIADEASAKAYLAQAESPAGDPFDLRGVNWLAKDKIVSTAVSARSFMDARKQPGSKAPEAYLGLGRNAAVSATSALAVAKVRSAAGEAMADCSWPLATWNRPISEAELLKARMLLSGQGTDLMVGPAFSDTAIKSRGDLNNFRILHFATHGLVTPPQPSCPARPALVTSFGQQGSDGLLSFSEIFDLRLDADMVILSACDTAGQADVAATRDAGIVTGGGSALEGLVRAFIGAGSRSVLASHWPAPDDFDATARLINGLFAATPGTATGEALLKAQDALMADVDTSHPYYWAGFAIIGDAARPLVAQGVRMTAVQAVVPTAMKKVSGGK